MPLSGPRGHSDTSRPSRIRNLKGTEWTWELCFYHRYLQQGVEVWPWTRETNFFTGLYSAKVQERQDNLVISWSNRICSEFKKSQRVLTRRTLLMLIFGLRLRGSICPWYTLNLQRPMNGREESKVLGLEKFPYQTKEYMLRDLNIYCVHLTGVSMS